MISAFDAISWARNATTWVCLATPGVGSSLDSWWPISALVCRYRLGEHHETLRMARRGLAALRASRYAPDPRQPRNEQRRMLLIFVRRLTRHVAGYVSPACGWCSDTGIEYRVSGPDHYPIACHACQPVAHAQQLRWR